MFLSITVHLSNHKGDIAQVGGVSQTSEVTHMTKNQNNDRITIQKSEQVYYY